MSGLSKREKELVSIGAAIGSSCVPCIVFHVKIAKGCGVTNSELAEAIELADKLKKVPASLVLNAANEEIDGASTEINEYTDDQRECSC
jgi:4-carboxymuconolactone decarboxylase